MPAASNEAEFGTSSKVDFVAAVRCLSDTNWPGWVLFAVPN